MPRYYVFSQDDVDAFFNALESIPVALRKQNLGSTWARSSLSGEVPKVGGVFQTRFGAVCHDEDNGQVDLYSTDAAEKYFGHNRFWDTYECYDDCMKIDADSVDALLADIKNRLENFIHHNSLGRYFDPYNPDQSFYGEDEYNQLFSIIERKTAIPEGQLFQRNYM